MQGANHQAHQVKLSNNDLIKLFKEDLRRRIKLIEEEKNSLEDLCNSLINPILKFVEESTKKLNEIENSYFIKCHKIIVEGKKNISLNFNFFNIFRKNKSTLLC
jgi:hypothetical protein